jgi:starvation-inducible outer membrane lipoprotein
MDSAEPSVRDANDGRIWQAYINGFLDGVMFGDNTICTEGATVGTLSRVYVAYMEKNPN